MRFRTHLRLVLTRRREEMFRRWRETEWGAIRSHRKQDKEPKQAKRWIGASFEVGNILGVNILEAEPAESIRERISNRSNRSTRSGPEASSSHLPMNTNERAGASATSFYTGEGATSFYTPDSGGSMLRPPIAAEEDGRKAQSDYAQRPALETSTLAVKSDSHIPVIAKQRERAVHYAELPVREVDSPAPPSEVLERSASEIRDTSAEAMSSPTPDRHIPWGEIVMRGKPPSSVVRGKSLTVEQIGCSSELATPKANPLGPS